MSSVHTKRFPHLRLAIWVLATALAALVAAGPAVAAQARHVRIEVRDSFVDAFLSEACGTEVVLSTNASLNVTLVYNQAGLIVREIDPASGGMNTFTAPETGRSVSWPFNSTIIDFGDGAEVGSPFTMKVVGLIGHVPGYIDSDAGQAVLAGFVKGFDENGTPRLEFTEFMGAHGNFNAGEDVVAALCAALTTEG